MIASGIFVLLLCTLLSMRLDKRRVTTTLFLLSLVAITALFAHHASDSLQIGL